MPETPESPKKFQISLNLDFTDRLEVPIGFDVALKMGEETIAIGHVFAFRGPGRSISGAVIGFPRDDYDFPVMLIDWDEGRGPGHGMVDHMPLCDIVLNEDYRINYLDKLDDIFREYYDIIGPPSLHVWFRTLTGPYYSFFRTKSGGTPEYRQRILNLPLKYLDKWVETVQAAKPIEDPAHREYCIKRKRVLQEWLFDRDPVTSVMLRVYGKEIGSLVMKGLS